MIKRHTDPAAVIVGTDPAHRTVTIRCPYCRGRHHHVMADAADRHRASPCSPGGYWLLTGREVLKRNKEITTS